MQNIKIVDVDKLRKMQQATTGDRRHVIDALLAQKSETVAFANVYKVANANMIAARPIEQRKQDTDYVTRYYVSELATRFAVISHDGKSGGRGASLKAFEVTK